jgi:hypothetical protein
MVRRIIVVSSLLLCACSSSGGTSSSPGPLVDNTKWTPTTDGEAFFGTPPENATCDTTPIDCPEYPWPEGECVDLSRSSCVAAFVPECLPPFTVMAVYTRMPGNPTLPLCNWLTLSQPSQRDIVAGDQVEIRMRHAQLTAPVGASARIMFVIGDEVAVDYEVPIPNVSDFPSETWIAPKNYPAGTQLLFHVDNHGSNEYMLIEVSVL